MNRRQAEHAIKKMFMSGYGHYSRAQEHEIIMSLLQGNQPQLSDSDLGDVEFAHKAITQFPLAEQPLRALKNSLICAVAVMCRYAADLGADDEKCYALSDYYINEIEARADMNNWGKIMEEICKHYIELVRAGRERKYSLPVNRAIRYIDQHIYGTCKLKDIAKELKLHSNYLSSLFKDETGISVTQYIRNKKIEEAKYLLRNGEFSISEIAEMLGFNSLSYFSKVFQQGVGCSPREYRHIEGK